MAHKIMRLVVLCLMPLWSFSQVDEKFSIGDSMPAMVFKRIFNRPGDSVSIKDYQGKLIILDFWNKWCGSCIEAFPKMEKLQKEFGDKIKIILITNDKNEDLIKLFTRVKYPALPIVSNDSILNNMFPHASVPHHVWINPDGRIQFITDGYNATSQNIKNVLDGKNVTLRVKKEAKDFDKSSDLWNEGKGRLQQFIHSYSFAMTKLNEMIDGTYYTYRKDTVNNTCGFKFVNVSLLDIYKIAYGGGISSANNEFVFNNRVQCDLPGGIAFFKYPENADSIPSWEARNIICYESKWKIENDSIAYQYLQNDVNRFFDFYVGVENKKTPCYALRKKNSISDAKLNNDEKFMRYTDSSYSLKNKPVSVMIQSLNGMRLFETMPVIDETCFPGNIDICLVNAFSDISALKTQLERYGFELEEVVRELKVLVINKKRSQYF